MQKQFLERSLQLIGPKNLYQMKKLIQLSWDIQFIAQEQCLLILEKKKIKIFCQASYNIYDSSYEETSWNQISRKSFNIISKKVKKKYISRYWQNRLKGKGNYNDAKVAGSIKNKILNYPKNVILLHIFKDSPFNYIDDKRIFMIISTG